MPSNITQFHIAGIGPSDVAEDVMSIDAVVRRLAETFASQGVNLQFHHWTKLPPGIGTPQVHITPVVFILKNPRGEEFVFDTRHHTAQDIADWLAMSMGLQVTVGISLRKVLLERLRRALQENSGVIQLWLGNMIQADCKELKSKGQTSNLPPSSAKKRRQGLIRRTCHWTSSARRRRSDETKRAIQALLSDL